MDLLQAFSQKKFVVSSNWEAMRKTVANSEATPALPSNNLVAIDCEMVGIGPEGRESALARVSIVDGDEKVLLDIYVKPNAKVTDLRTAVSGITWAHINSPDALSEDEAKQRVRALVKGKLLIGHALQNDFAVLGFEHSRHLVRDTSKYRPFRINEKKTPKLKTLAKRWLDADIQNGEHDSVQDASIAMRLYKLNAKAWEKQMAPAMKSHQQALKESKKMRKRKLEEDQGEVVETENVPSKDTNHVAKKKKQK